MLTCGLKLTHDSAVAIFEDTKLIANIELEKIGNNNRFKILDDLQMIPGILAEEGYDYRDVDLFCVDGWKGLVPAQVNTFTGKKGIALSVAPYHEACLSEPVLRRYPFQSTLFDQNLIHYESYQHVAGHIAGAYSTSPFAQRGENSYILVWDGGMFPRLYFLNALSAELMNLGPIFFWGANAYSVFAQHFGPFKINENVIKDELSVAGKVMAYTAYGSNVPQIRDDLQEVYNSLLSQATNMECIPVFPYEFTRKFKQLTKDKDYNDEDVITSFHHYLEDLLVSSLIDKIGKHSNKCFNLCYSGGAALNIKWNSAIRSIGLFEEIWIPPFPNDSGSAAGVAICGIATRIKDTLPHTTWNVYSGSKIIVNEPYSGWEKKQCTISDLAKIVHDSNEPIIFLNGRAELGPRALGNRSILMAATSSRARHVLNTIKYREPYRPIAPICLEEKSGEVFQPGGHDPFMLFSHNVRKEWQDRVPAICHVDGSARLQTVTLSQNYVIYSLLKAYETISGIPLLCNTSANLKGSGFFPDVYSATRWGKVNFVWCNNILYEKQSKVDLDNLF